MRRNRSFYFLITLFVVLIGILSRKIDSIPLFIGDVLYAVMVYFGCRVLFVHFVHSKKIIVPLVICYLIELQQLSDASWLVSIRNTTLGHYALGQGFLWSDLVCYAVGVGIGFLLDYKTVRF
ncbi:DUF2809 domain-containing protein [Flavobacterium sp. CYK-55]|uniref:ribosomal maturation YjgA family protein n=1 Tax=Flavobacterium sp. CYK-55 TaxID=2835529 RepID=UPI001BCF4F6B|nr:DUF2809 domain-containing protein [Flavobacterium sp. CYK-55]MBS7787730.1 DUF2809 domain-containing protein [Flavobacterium sp. CYK-55]